MQMKPSPRRLQGFFGALLLRTTAASAEEANSVQGGRSCEAKYVVFDPAGSQGTVPIGDNLAGGIAGYYFDGSTDHGFSRSPAGKLTSFDPPGSIYTLVFSINLEGATTGA
ncbi:MAG: hypothetical protein ACLQDQ_02495 [Myxococcaceae bacterium]